MNDTLTCPFCGGFVRIVACDVLGNIHTEEYENNPCSGLGYQLMHERKDVPTGVKCPIATLDHDEQCLGSYIYASRNNAYNAWVGKTNRC